MRKLPGGGESIFTIRDLTTMLGSDSSKAVVQILEANGWSRLRIQLVIATRSVRSDSNYYI
jgi:hypothetical protein